MPLKIIVIGAGIGGLCAAAALHRAGHEVQILEKSTFAGEAGAALLITPNGCRVLRDLGFSFDRAYGDPMTRWEVLDGLTLATLDGTELTDAEVRYGAPLYTMLRADLHDELMRLTKVDLPGVPGVEIRTGTKVRCVDPAQGVVMTEDGGRYSADLIVGADGLHSVARAAVLGKSGVPARPSGMSAFRFQIPTSALKHDHHFQELSKTKGRGSTVLADTAETGSERHLVWYDCHHGQVQNFVGIHTASENEHGDTKSTMLTEFAHFHPSIIHIIRTATNVSDWPLMIHEPLSSWHSHTTVLMGDAAHPMLPFSGQGANQAIEDAGALGELFRDTHDPSAIPLRLRDFETVRRLRASRIQILSNVRLGKEEEVGEQLTKYADAWVPHVPRDFRQRYEHDFSFDVLLKCREVVRLTTTEDVTFLDLHADARNGDDEAHRLMG